MLTIKKTGMMVLVQDAGRFGSQHIGVGPAGPMDWVSHHLANISVGNTPGAAAIEVTGDRAEIEFHRESLVCVSGRNGIVGGSLMPANRPFLLPAGQTLKFAAGPGPLRSYVGVSGGIAAAPVMGSVSWSTVASLGQYMQSGLPANSNLAIGNESRWAASWRSWLRGTGRAYPGWAHKQLISYCGEKNLCVRVIRETRMECSETDWQGLLAGRYEISTQSNRMGYRLDGPELRSKRSDVVSRAVVTGAIQLPPSGKPIILLSDRQTVGGYPILGYVASVDLPLLARAHARSIVSFSQIGHAEAQSKYIDTHRALGAVESALLKLSPESRNG
jgi:antagonist of KipI